MKSFITSLLTALVALSAIAWTAHAQTNDGSWIFYAPPPERISMPMIVYPDEAIRRRVEGTVRVQALVEEDGRVSETHVVHSIPLLDREAVRIVRESLWKPARNEQGQPVAVWVEVPITFVLRGEGWV